MSSCGEPPRYLLASADCTSREIACLLDNSLQSSVHPHVRKRWSLADHSLGHPPAAPAEWRGCNACTPSKISHFCGYESEWFRIGWYICPARRSDTPGNG